MRSRICFLLAAALVSLLAAGCSGFGRVEQGQVIAYDRSAGVVTLIRDSNYRDPAHPRFDVLPPVSVRVPRDPKEMGPEPEAGRLLALDWKAGRAVIFDPASESLKQVPLTVLEVLTNVARDDARLGGRRFPVLDRQSGTVTVLLPRWRVIVTFRPPEEYLGLPEDTWKVGDEVRYYYKDPEQALRMMNVSKTELGGKSA